MAEKKAMEDRLKANIPRSSQELVKMPVLATQEGTVKVDLPLLEPRHLTLEHTCKMYQLHEQCVSLMQQHLPLPKSITNDLELLQQAAVLLRPLTVQVFQQMQKIVSNETHSQSAVFWLDGEKRSGKSMSLLTLAVLAIQAKWIVLYLPNLSKWTGGYYPFYPNDHQFDQPELAQDFLYQTFGFNKALFSEMTLEFTFNSQLEKGSPLTDLVQLGVKQENMAMKVAEHLMRELAAQTQFPVLLACDHANALFSPTQYKDQKSQLLLPERLTLVNMIRQYFGDANRFKRGIFVGAPDGCDTFVVKNSVLMPYLRILRTRQRPLLPFPADLKKEEAKIFAQQVGISYAEAMKDDLNAGIKACMHQEQVPLEMSLTDKSSELLELDQMPILQKQLATWRYTSAHPAFGQPKLTVFDVAALPVQNVFYQRVCRLTIPEMETLLRYYQQKGAIDRTLFYTFISFVLAVPLTERYVDTKRILSASYAGRVLALCGYDHFFGMRA